MRPSRRTIRSAVIHSIGRPPSVPWSRSSMITPSSVEPQRSISPRRSGMESNSDAASRRSPATPRSGGDSGWIRRTSGAQSGAKCSTNRSVGPPPAQPRPNCSANSFDIQTVGILTKVEGRSTKAEQAEATRARLLRVSRELFAKRGYSGVATEEIVRRAKVTRGALYHHFRDKRDLFRAVHEQMEQELVERIGEQMQGVEDPMELLNSGLRAFLDACTDPAVIQIALVDAPTVLGWAEWREIDEKYGLGLVTFGLQNAMDSGALRRQEIRPL